MTTFNTNNLAHATADLELAVRDFCGEINRAASRSQHPGAAKEANSAVARLMDTSGAAASQARNIIGQLKAAADAQAAAENADFDTRLNNLMAAAATASPQDKAALRAKMDALLATL